MKHLPQLAVSAALMAITPASSEPSSIVKPHCPYDSRVEDVPELLFSFDSFTQEAFAKDIAALRVHIPEWIEEKNKRLLEHKTIKEHPIIFEGELSMAYTNTLTAVEGYILKLEYLSADESTRPQKEKAFCDFINKHIIID